MAKAQSILSLIEAEHRKTEKLFEDLENSKDSKKSQELFNQIYKDLTLHARTEELVFYPALREHKETEKYLEEAEQEHASAKLLLEEMKALQPTDSEFKARLKGLKESVMHHVKEEESEIFEAVKSCMNDKELEQLGQEFQSAESRIEPDVQAAMV